MISVIKVRLGSFLLRLNRTTSFIKARFLSSSAIFNKLDGRHQSKSSRLPKASDDDSKEPLELSKDRDITLKSSIALKKAIGKQENHIKKLENAVEEKDKSTQILSQDRDNVKRLLKNCDMQNKLCLKSPLA